MAAPILTVTDPTSSTITSLAYGNVNAGATSVNFPILVWNNQGGSSVVSDATNVTLTTLTYNGLVSGDTIANGQQVVSNEMLLIQCTTQGDGGYTPVGGNTTAPISNSPSGLNTSNNTGTIQGVVGGSYALVNTFINAPSNVTAGAVQFLIRCSYLYT